MMKEFTEQRKRLTLQDLSILKERKEDHPLRKGKRVSQNHNHKNPANSNLSDHDKASKNQARQKVKETLAWLAETFPACFNFQNPKPLKLKIEEEIFLHLPQFNVISRKAVRNALAFYTHNKKYQQSLLDEEDRFDLQGNAIEKIQPEHKEFAVKKIDSFKNKKKNKLSITAG